MIFTVTLENIFHMLEWRDKDLSIDELDVSSNEVDLKNEPSNNGPRDAQNIINSNTDRNIKRIYL